MIDFISYIYLIFIQLINKILVVHWKVLTFIVAILTFKLTDY